ncbi:MAG TPA: carbohydrate ABC transporter permease [Clostridia bacterium]|nr:carbohydrate ABC transporter permease [Clostridia bacterium]
MKTLYKILMKILGYFLLACALVVSIYPVLWMILGSLKDTNAFYNNIWGLPGVFHWGNYVYSWNKAAIGQKYINTVMITAGFLALLLPTVSAAAYAIARLNFKGKKKIYMFFLSGIMVPSGILAIPSFIVANQLHLTNTRIGMMLFYTAQATAFGIFLMRSFFISLPKSLEEAAMIDGCSRFGSFLRIILPLSVPGIMTQVVYSGLVVWNEYMIASLFVRSTELQTLALGLKVFIGQYSTDYPSLFAAMVLVTIPMLILYICAQKTFIAGMTAGAVKG